MGEMLCPDSWVENRYRHKNNWKYIIKVNFCFFVVGRSFCGKGQKGFYRRFALSCKHQTWSCRADLLLVPSGKTKKFSSSLFLTYSYVWGLTTRPGAGAGSPACRVLAQPGKEKVTENNKRKEKRSSKELWSSVRTDDDITRRWKHCLC